LVRALVPIFPVDALQHDKPDISALVGIFAKIDRMRVQSSPKVVESAERVARKIVDAYLAPDKSFLELCEMLDSGAIDLLSEFSNACPCGIRLASFSAILNGPYFTQRCLEPQGTTGTDGARQRLFRARFDREHLMQAME
jgi:hypothetical protein